MYQKFFHYVLPSMLAFAFSGLYTIIDGFFIGRNIGDVGLASINIAFPLVAFIQAVGTGLGMGGAIQISVCRGKNDTQLEQKYFSTTLRLLLIAGFAMVPLLLLLGCPILSALGAQGVVLDCAMDYIQVIAFGAIFQLCATGFTPLLRNYNKSILAMTAMIAGFFTNIVLDWLFVSVFQYKMAGAAWATVIGQIVTVLPCLVFLCKKAVKSSLSYYKWNYSIVSTMIKAGISPFGLTMSPFLVMMIMNKWAVAYGGETAVAAYAVISYVTSIIILLLQGIGDGSQPLISLSLGEGKLDDTKTIRKLAYCFSAFIAVITGSSILLLKSSIPNVFGASQEVASMVMHSISFFVFGFLFIAFCRVTTSYFYATQKNIFAYIMVYGEPILLLLLLTGFFPGFMQLEGVWVSALTAQILLSVIGFILILIENKKDTKITKLKKISKLEL